MPPRSYEEDNDDEMDDQNVAEDMSNVLRILIATDNHLGYGEKWPERQLDSFITFEEILEIATKENVDFVLLGGDLFHENRPSRFAENQCLQILKKHVYGNRPISVSMVSDPERIFAHCPPDQRRVNYMNPDLNIALPIFSIHGNHDDPCGLGGLCSLDNLHASGLVNYFGKVDNLKGILHFHSFRTIFVKCNVFSFTF